MIRMKNVTEVYDSSDTVALHATLSPIAIAVPSAVSVPASTVASNRRSPEPSAVLTR